MKIRKILKWFGIVVGSLLGIVLLGVTTIYVMIGSDLDRRFDGEGSNVVIPDDAASIAEGERQARLRGCNGGCHGETVNGRIFFEIPDGTQFTAPDLGRIAQTYSIRELERVIRHGVRPDGTSVVLAMPSSMFYYLNDDDLGEIIAFLKSQPPGDTELPTSRLGPVARLFFFQFKQLIGTILSAEYIDDNPPQLDSSVNESANYGRYLAMTVCSECHGRDLRGGPDDFSPTLAIVAAYTLENFRKLVREGEPIGGRELDLMADIAVDRLSVFTDAEINALHAYLKTMAATAPAP